MDRKAKGEAVQEDLLRLKAKIDATDETIVALLSKRFALTHRVGELKAMVGEAPLNPQRQAERQRLLQMLATFHGVGFTLVSDLFARVQRETLAMHERLAKVRPTATRSGESTPTW